MTDYEKWAVSATGTERECEGLGALIRVDSTLPRDMLVVKDPERGVIGGRYIGPLASARTSADTQSADCPSLETGGRDES